MKKNLLLICAAVLLVFTACYGNGVSDESIVPATNDISETSAEVSSPEVNSEKENSPIEDDADAMKSIDTVSFICNAFNPQEDEMYTDF